MVVTAACADGSGSEVDEGAEEAVVGFIFVGERDDLGYNQAAWEASEALARSEPSLTVLRVEDVPETEAAVDAMEDLIDRGAGLVFATSFGHLPFALEVARAHPDVVVVHQGGREPEEPLPNFGTYFGTHHEILYAAGIGAARDSTSGRLGYVVAFPIAATYSNVDAFLLGARSVRPEATVDVVFTDDWCDPEAQQAAFDRLLGAGVDVIAMHQDCTRQLLVAAEEAGIGVVGYHADGSEVAPGAWITGSVWTWVDVYRDVAEAWLEGRFATSPFSSDHRGTLAGGDNPAGLADPGARVPDDVVREMEQVLVDFSRERSHPFDGPVVDVDGVVRVPAGEALTQEEIDAMDFFVEGVTVLEP